jgi:hypothetical protein
MTEVSSTRLYLGNLPRNGTPALMSSMKTFSVDRCCDNQGAVGSSWTFDTAMEGSPPPLSGSGTLVQADSFLFFES